MVKYRSSAVSLKFRENTENVGRLSENLESSEDNIRSIPLNSKNFIDRVIWKKEHTYVVIIYFPFDSAKAWPVNPSRESPFKRNPLAKNGWKSMVAALRVLDSQLSATPLISTRHVS